MLTLESGTARLEVAPEIGGRIRHGSFDFEDPLVATATWSWQLENG